MARALGIDLGTTHTLAAWVDERGKPRLIGLDRGPLLPSAVDYGTAPPAVGAAALEAAAERPGEVVLSVKRLMGRGPAEAEGGADPEGEGGALRLDVGGRQVTPVEVSAEILRALRRRAAAALGEPPGGCVVTVPAYFDDAQRQATRDAARLAGLELLRLLPEPTAAALAYGLERRVRGTFAVYDLGGGTFDLSVLRLEDGLFEVLSTAGDTRLGGDDLDRALAEALLRGAGLPPEPSPPVWRALRAAARAARERLSAEPEVALDLALPGGARIARRLVREELEALLLPALARTGALCRRALADAGLGPAALDGVLLVGGVTRTPALRRFVRDLFGQEPLTDADPETAVAEGAALQADALWRGGRPDLLLLDVIPLSLGVELMGGVVERLVPRNATIPASATAEFTTHADGQTGLVIHVLQGERELARDCRSLARFTLRGIPPLPAGAARVRITFTVDADGILSVSAREEITGLEQAVQVRPTSGLDEAEVSRLLAEALEREGPDLAARILAELRVQADRSLSALRAALAEDGDLLPAPEREALDLRVRGLEEAMAGDDPGALQAWLESLEGAAAPFAERRVERHVALALRGRHVEDVAAGRRAQPGPGEPRE